VIYILLYIQSGYSGITIKTTVILIYIYIYIYIYIKEKYYKDQL